MSDSSAGRTPDERLNEWLERAWGYDQDSDAFAPPRCAVCGEPITAEDGRLHHVLPQNASWVTLAYLAGRTAHQPKIA